MYEFLADEEWWKHSQQIAEAFDKIEIHWEIVNYKGSYLPDISMDEVKALKVPHTIVYDEAKPVYVIITRKFPLVCWIRIKHDDPNVQVL